MDASGEQLDEILQGRFIRRVLNEEADNIDKAQVKYMRSHGFSNQDWYNERSFLVNDESMVYSQLLKHRFVDMKFISAAMEKHKKKSHPVYNKIFWGHYNNVIRQLKYGFTDSIKEQLRALGE